MKYFLHYIITFIVFLGVDMIWLGIIAKDLYASAIGHLMSENINWIAALSFYFIFIFGILVFVLEPALKEGNVLKMILTAALFGLVTYSTYDLTNLATLKDWPLSITFIDLMWGSSLSILVSTGAYYVIQFFRL